MVESVETLSVSISGPAFSLLAYDNVRSKYDQEGFLLGEIIEKKTNSITDHDRQITKIERIMKINSALPYPKLGYFYDAAGRLNDIQITTFLEDQRTDRVKVVAWYKFKHTNAFKMTLREKIVHKNLAEYFALANPDLFACCLLTTDSSPNGATHTYSQTFLRYADCMYQMIPMHIVNLSDPSNIYKSIEPSSDTFKELVKSLQIDGNQVPGSVIVTKINEKLERQTEQKVKELAEKEKICCELEKEVRKLMELLKEKQSSSDINITELIKVESCSGDDTELIKVESGNGEDGVCAMDITSVAENISGSIRSNRGRKKSGQAATITNSPISPVRSRSRRNTTTPQKSKD